MERRNVALVISNLEFGGAQRQLVELANNLPSDRFRVHVISLANYVPLARNLKLPPSRFHIIEKKRKYDVSVVTRLAKLFREHDIALVHAFLFDAEIATRIACKMSNALVMIGSERNSDYLVKRNQRIAYRITRSLRDLCIANSNSGARFNSTALGHPMSHYRVVYNCVDTSRFRPRDQSRCRRDADLSEELFVIGMFASIKPQKNHEMLLRAIHSNADLQRNVKILFVGDVLHLGAQDTDSYSKHIRRMVDEYGLVDMCEFMGNREEVEFLYPACDITVLPSRFEGLPNVVLESLSCGIPTVATDVSDNALIIDHGVNGFIVQLDDDQALADQLFNLMANRELRTNMGKEARKKAENEFSPMAFGESVSRIYTEILDDALVQSNFRSSVKT